MIGPVGARQKMPPAVAGIDEQAGKVCSVLDLLPPAKSVRDLGAR